MKKIMSIVLCLAMLFSMASVSAFAVDMDTTSMQVPQTANFSINGQDVEVNIVTSEDQIVPYAEPTDLYYSEDTTILAGGDFSVNVNPTKGRKLRVWLLVKSGNVELKVVRRGLLWYTTEYDQTFGTGDVDVQTVSSCKDATYQVQFWDKTGVYSQVSMLIYETD